ncbi:hypothetical protein GCM10007171_18310 [Dickeya fangzhongdai]|nr:hypothetical protein GCM10007171_18310 [Dickeya fangzhongdai]
MQRFDLPGNLRADANQFTRVDGTVGQHSLLQIADIHRGRNIIRRGGRPGQAKDDEQGNGGKAGQKPPETAGAGSESHQNKSILG